MSSPPPPHNTAYPSSSLQNPRKRPSLQTTSTDNPSKRRKPSIAGSALSSGHPHPLRQTSFPPPEHQASRQSSFSPPASLTARSSIVGGTTRRGRGGRKRGGGGGGGDARSVAGTSATGRGGGGGRTSAAGRGVDEDEAGDEEDDDDDAGGAGDLLADPSSIPDEAQQKLEREHMRMLIDAFDEQQSARYDTWRRVKLNQVVVRRLINQTLSQSVPASIIVTVKAYTKLFAGELVERAREVQGEWLAAAGVGVEKGKKETDGENVEVKGKEEGKGGKEKASVDGAVVSGTADGTTPNETTNGTNGTNGTTATNGDTDPNGTSFPAFTSTTPTPAPTDTTATDSPKVPKKPDLQQQQRSTISEIDKGPITPDHLREALRRYKRDREGEGTGFQGLSLYGRVNTAARSGGRRLFR